ncbi:MAG: response regulator transcription factor [Acidobacteriota bacterium]|nr:response regulator transcription factor [Acidobacteriota bacterium]
MPPPRRLRVLLADDHASVRQGIRALFQSVPGVDVVHDVAGGDAALEAVRALAPDIVVIDLAMRPTDHLTVIRRIQEARRQTKVIVLTRHQEPAYAREAFAAGASGYVLKQSPFEELRRAVEMVARGGQHIDAGLQHVETGLAEALTSVVSTRELEVLRRASLGHPNKEIGKAFGIAVKTVEVHKSNAMKKLELRDRSELIRYASRHGWLRDA